MLGPQWREGQEPSAGNQYVFRSRTHLQRQSVQGRDSKFGTGSCHVDPHSVYSQYDEFASWSSGNTIYIPRAC